jgi:hypothetical protein
MQKFLALVVLAGLTAGCVSNGAATYHVHQGGGGSGGAGISGGQTQAESQAESGEMNPGETTGGETQGGTTDDGEDAGFDAISG